MVLNGRDSVQLLEGLGVGSGMQVAQIAVLGCWLAMAGAMLGQGRGAARVGKPEPVGMSQLRIGEEGVIWYATWEGALAEAKRSQRPIFFMAAACQAGSVSGVF